VNVTAPLLYGVAAEGLWDRSTCFKGHAEPSQAELQQHFVRPAHLLQWEQSEIVHDYSAFRSFLHCTCLKLQPAGSRKQRAATRATQAARTRAPRRAAPPQACAPEAPRRRQLPAARRVLMSVVADALCATATALLDGASSRLLPPPRQCAIASIMSSLRRCRWCASKQTPQPNHSTPEAHTSDQMTVPSAPHAAASSGCRPPPEDMNESATAAPGSGNGGSASKLRATF